MRRAARIIHAGGIVAYPTEGVFGLGCDPQCHEAVSRILDLKRRPESAGLILIAKSRAQLDGWIDPTPAEQKRLQSRQADVVTWVVSADPRTPEWVTGGRATVAVRITHHPIAAGLCHFSDTPLISTSANRRGRPPARSILTARRRFGQHVDCIVAGSIGARTAPSEIRDARTGSILRAG